MTASLPSERLSARLHHIALESPNPETLANFHAKIMGLSVRPSASGGLYGEAPGRRLFFVPGEAKRLAYAAFAAESQSALNQLRARLEATNWPFETIGIGTEQFEAGAIRLVDPDGNCFMFGLADSDDAQASSALPARLQHVVVASTAAERLSNFFQTVLGFTLSDNVVDDAGNLMTAFLRCSDEHHSFAVFQASTNRFDHHCYEAGDWSLIRDWADHFARNDIKIEWGPGRHGPGNNLFLFIHDLDGNWLEISAELETVQPNRPVGRWPHSQRTLNQWGSAPLRT